LKNVAEANADNNPHLFVKLDGEKMRLVDWHDYKRIQEDLARVGPGEQGAGVYLTGKSSGFECFRFSQNLT
jgi:hypothetical protein